MSLLKTRERKDFPDQNDNGNTYYTYGTAQRQLDTHGRLTRECLLSDTRVI